MVRTVSTNNTHETCQEFTVSLSKTGNLQEEEKALMLQKYGDHLEKAKKQRDYYRDQCQESKEIFTNLSQNQRMRGKFIYLLQENFTTKTCTCM